MFSLSEGSQQSTPTAVALAATAPAAEAVTGTSVFPAVSSKGVAETPTSSMGVASAAVPAAAPSTVILLPLMRRWRGQLDSSRKKSRLLERRHRTRQWRRHR